MEREGFGRDRVPDLFFANFKMTDIAGHKFTFDSQQMAENLEAQDAALRRILDYLDEEVRDYVVIVTADHGHTPPPGQSGAWPISPTELIADLDRHFEIPPERSLVREHHAVGFFLNRRVAESLRISEAQVARYINDYTLGDNWPEEELPVGYEERAGERVFAAAFPSSELEEFVRCASGPD